jgi:hypothetical protein
MFGSGEISYQNGYFFNRILVLARDYKQEKNIGKTVKLRKLFLTHISDFN